MGPEKQYMTKKWHGQHHPAPSIFGIAFPFGHIFFRFIQLGCHMPQQMPLNRRVYNRNARVSSVHLDNNKFTSVQNV